jgi:predicted nucleic acid-binding protein
MPEVVAKAHRSLDDVQAEPFTREMAVLAAEIDAGIGKSGLVIATADLLSAVVALHHHYARGPRP